MKDKILAIIKEKPKHYSLYIKKNKEMAEWVETHSITDSDYYPEIIYSALHNESNICEYGNKKHISRISDGWVCCGIASKCKCTANAISTNVTKTKKLTSAAENSAINLKRETTMIERFGVPFSLQRTEVRASLSKSKLSKENELLLNDKEWLYKEYVTEQKSLTEIAANLNIYYGTVGEYCRKYDFVIRQRTNYSIQEKEICNFLDTINIPYIHSDWSALKSKEIDVFIPSHNFGIELNGLYWHSFNPYCNHTPKIENVNKHRDKTMLARSNNIDLIQITDNEWEHKTNIVKSIIKTKLGVANKTYARQFTIKLVSSIEEKEFLNTNHLQGYVASTMALGLYKDNQLYMIMTFGKPRYSKIADVELLRLCTRIDYVVVGGLHKLFKESIKQYKDMSIVSYCDMSKFSGSGYKALGFELINNSTPGFFWTDGSCVISRYKCHKSQMKQWLKSYDEDKSQSENMFQAGYRRYYDCGQSTWLLKL